MQSLSSARQQLLLIAISRSAACARSVWILFRVPVRCKRFGAADKRLGMTGNGAFTAKNTAFHAGAMSSLPDVPWKSENRHPVPLGFDWCGTMGRLRAMNSRELLAALASLALTSLGTAADATFTDAESAGADFQLQGEYAGENCGAQVIALGEGRFHLVGWDSGLPGASPDAKKNQEMDGSLEKGVVHFKNADWDAMLKGGQLTGVNKDGATSTLKRVERKSPTLGAKPPSGATVLFDGTSADAWKNGKVDRDGNLQWGTVSRQEFGDFSLHVEFRLPFKPAARGQARGNSGVYLQDRYEVQVLDSFGLKGENNECGGIYGKHKPAVNMCFPPLSWQTYDVEFEAAKWDAEGKKLKNAIVTVKHNGVLIHDRAEVDGTTASAGRKEGPGPGPIQLQNHGNPVVFRNIWVVEKK
jgi:hypothetical protein